VNANRLKLAPAAEDILAASDADDDKLNAGIAEDLAAKLARDIPTTTTLIVGTRVMLEGQIKNYRAEKAELQRTIALSTAKVRQISGAIRGLEDALDSLMESEA